MALFDFMTHSVSLLIMKYSYNEQHCQDQNRNNL
jgi:hypothetical protein